MEKLSRLDFIVQYGSGENVLSRLYEFGVPGTMQASCEYVDHDPLWTTHLVVPTRRPLLSSRLLSWLARTWLLRLIVVIALRAGRLRQSTRRQSTPLARRPAKDLPVPVTLPGGSVSSPKWRDRPPKVAPLRLDESLVHLSEVGPPVQSDKPKRGRRPVTDTHTLHR